MRNYVSLHQTQVKVKEHLVVRKDMDVNEHEKLCNITQTQNKVKEHLVVRQDMDVNVNEHEKLYNITLRHKLK